MKKKAVVAMLIMCMAVSAAACGKSSDTEKTTTETTDTKDSEDSKEDSTDTDIKETDSSEGNRLVSVKDVSKYVTIGEYKGLELNRTSQSVTDDDVQAEINYDLEDNGTEVKDGTVENGDTVTINFTGTIDGKEFDGGSAEDYELVVGDGEMIDGFEDGIVGMKSGETKELDLTFPDDYYEESVAGKAVVFKVTLQKFTRQLRNSSKTQQRRPQIMGFTATHGMKYRQLPKSKIIRRKMLTQQRNPIRNSMKSM